jgi:hypothetical protein
MSPRRKERHMKATKLGDHKTTKDVPEVEDTFPQYQEEAEVSDEDLEHIAGGRNGDHRPPTL